jgi:hypothetical protein
MLLGVPKSFTCRHVGLESQGIWVVSVYVSMVLGYGDTGEYISLSMVEVVGGRLLVFIKCK